MKMKKTLSLLLALLLCLNLAPPALADNTPFTDVSDSHWAYSEIMEAYNDGAVNGTSANAYNPNGNVTMAQFIAILTRAFHPEDVENASSESGAWYVPNYSVAEQIGIFENIPDTSPETEVTREVMAQIMYNLMVAELTREVVDNSLSSSEFQATKNKIPDFASVKSSFKDAVVTCYGLGLIAGVDSSGSFAPKGRMNRAQTAVIYVRLKEVMGTGEEIGTGTNPSNETQQPSQPIQSTQTQPTQPSTTATSSFVVEKKPSPKPLEIVDYGWYFSSQSGDTAYVNFCGIIYNPNDKLIAKFPEVLVTVKNGDGSVLATKGQTGSIIMPEDTITLCGMFSMPISDLTDDAKIYFDVEWSDLGKSTSIYRGARTTDFTISNVTERISSRENFITGEITNNYSEDIDKVNLSIVLRKDGKIVYMDNTFLDNLKVGKAKAFEFRRYKDWPEHDTIDVSAMVW